MKSVDNTILNVFYFIIIIVVGVGFYYVNSEHGVNGIGYETDLDYKNFDKTIIVDGNEYKVQVRDSEEERRRGLSSTTAHYLCDNCGLLFAWNEPGERVMWMKDMNYNIDMYWLDKDMQVLHAEHNVSKDSYNNSNPRQSKFYGRGLQAQYVLETKVR